MAPSPLPIRRLAAVIGVLLVAPLDARAAGYAQFPGYQGSKYPATAAVWTAVVDVTRPPASKRLFGSFLDTDGDRYADVAELLSFNIEAYGAGDLSGPTYVSPSDPSRYYVLVEKQDGSHHAVFQLRRVGETLSLEASIDIPEALDIGMVDTPAARGFFRDWMHIVAFRRVDGRDRILCVATHSSPSGFTFWTRYALLLDTDDADPFVDTWTDYEELTGIEGITIDDRGNLLGRVVRFAEPSGPYTLNRTEGLVRIVDTDGDPYGVPDAVDPASIVTSFSTFWTEVAYGVADLDMGADRLVLGATFPIAVDLDSYHRPIPGSDRELHRVAHNSEPAYDSYQPFVAHDGQPIDFAAKRLDGCGPLGNLGLVVWDDPDFDGVTDDTLRDPNVEVAHAVMTCDFDHQLYFGGVHVADLPEIPIAGSGTEVRFADFGEFPGGRTFTFPFGSKVNDSVWIGKHGIVSFGGPVTAHSSRAALEQLRGVIAPAWSSTWDTSQLEVVAGYAPMTKSFLPGRESEGVYAFAIEWRNLRQAGWDEERAFSLRLLMFSDGTWRVDYGAIGEVSAPFVVGYAGPGAHPVSQAVDVSAHSWGSEPAGTGAERVIAQEFTSANDLGHRWTRWTGYPERLDTPAPAPKIVDARLVQGKKITMLAAGSDIQTGAVLVVDGAETFALTQSKNGKKWVVSAKARSSPGNRTVQQIVGGAGSHTIVVVNPDGESSNPDTVP